MCRILYVWSRRELNYDRVANLLKTLVDANGGHGNGVGYFVEGQPIVKKFPPRSYGWWGKNYRGIYDIASLIAYKYDWPDHGYLFHTRLASRGDVDELNTQPILHNNIVLAHNGADIGWVELCKLNGLQPWKCEHYSDTYLLARYFTDMIKKLGSKKAFMWLWNWVSERPGNAIYVMTKRHVDILVNEKDFEFYATKDIIIAGSQSLRLITNSSVLTASKVWLRINKNREITVIRGALKA